MSLVTASAVSDLTGIDVNFKGMWLAIATADLIMNEDFASANISDSRKVHIALYLAGHFATLSKDGGPLSEDKLGDATERYHNIYAAGLKATRFGQQAMVLDITGTLSELANSAENPSKKSALFTVVTSTSKDYEL